MPVHVNMNLKGGLDSSLLAGNSQLSKQQDAWIKKREHGYSKQLLSFGAHL